VSRECIRVLLPRSAGISNRGGEYPDVRCFVIPPLLVSTPKSGQKME